MPSPKTTVVAVAAALAFVALWVMSPRTVEDLIRAAAVSAGAAAVAWLMPRRPVAAVGVTFLLAVFPWLSIGLSAGSLRPEQPALVTLIAATALYRAHLRLPPVRPLMPLILSAGAYLIVLAISSAVVADEPAASLRMVAWTGLSMVGGLAALLLVAGRASTVLPWLSGTAGVVAILGIVAAIGYTLFFLGDPWVFGTAGLNPKVNAFSHEPNLYASLLGAAIPIAAEVWRVRPSRTAFGILAVLLLAIGLGVTRGAYVGLAVGLVVYFLLAFRRSRLAGRAKRMALSIGVLGIVGFVLPLALVNPFNSGLLVGGPFYRLPETLPEFEPGLPFGLGTLGYRLHQVGLGLQDMAGSPIIGRGAFSFGQRHFEVGGEPAVIAVLPFAVAHDAGVVGLFAMTLFFGLVFVRLWRAGRDKLLAGPVAALTASLAALLVAYLATSALHFATTWILIGSAVGATIATRPIDESTPQDDRDQADVESA